MALLALALLASQAIAHSDPHPEMAEAAKRWLAALTPDQKSKATFAVENPERLNWHFIPRQRKGLSLGEMTPAQRHLAIGLLGSAMSQKGLLKATTIMSLEAILKELEQGNGPVRDPEAYFLSVFGEPHASHPWGWRFEGHHLSLNFTLVDGHPVAVTPSMMGSNPAEVRSGPRQGLRVLGNEEDLARNLLNSLSPSQLKMALIQEEAPSDVLLIPGRNATSLEPLGLPASKLTAEQRKQLDNLVNEYILNYRGDMVDTEMEHYAKSAPDTVHFAWAGSTLQGQAHYYRVQTPRFMIEYDNTQNQANHIHSLWRNLSNDFGVDILREHYEGPGHHTP